MLSRTLAALTLGITIFSTNTYSAERTTLFENEELLNQSVKTDNGLLRTSDDSTENSILYNLQSSILKNSDVSINFLEKTKNKNTQSLTYTQSYQGIPIWNQNFVIIVNKNNEISSAYGSLISSIASDIGNIEAISNFDLTTYLDTFIKDYFSDKERIFRNKKSEQFIFLDSDDIAHNSVMISFFTDLVHEKNNPEKIIAFIDLETGEILYRKNALMFAQDETGSGPGGNEKFEREDYSYNGEYDSNISDPETFIINKDGSICTMDALNVETRDASHEENPSEEAFSYSCGSENENTERWVNGAPSPMNDAQYHAQVTQRMFKSYLGDSPFKDKKIIQHVHYGSGFDNAFYEDGQMYYGDGDYMFYPMTSLDVVAHEIAHGYTAKYGWGSERLLIDGQARAINESFSDISAEAAEYYLKGTNDWRASRENYKIGSTDQALRYLNTPTRDGRSVDHLKDYNEDLGEHYNAGIFSKAFYYLATNQATNYDDNFGPWNTKYAFILFAQSNHRCWNPTSTFEEAAACVMGTAEYESFDNIINGDDPNDSDNKTWTNIELKNQLRKAFAQTGIILKTRSGLESEFTFQAAMGEISFDNTSRFDNKDIKDNKDDYIYEWDFGDSSQLSYEFKPVHTYAESGTYVVTLTVTSSDDQNIKDIYKLPVAVSKEYCDVQGTSYEKYYLSKVTINEKTKKSGYSAYSDYSDEPIDLGSSGFNIELTAGNHEGSQNSYKVFEVWIDANRDGKFTMDERQYSGQDQTSVNTSINIEREYDKTYRMRVLVSSIHRNETPCGELKLSEIEDYSLIWTENTDDIDFKITITKKDNDNIVIFSNLTNDDRVKKWRWDFDLSNSNGNGNDYSEKESPSFQYAKKGTYTVRLEALDSNYQVIGKAWVEEVTVEPKTIPKFIETMDENNTRRMEFDAGVSSYPINSVLKWDFNNDGNFEYIGGPEVTNDFAEEDKNYDVSLKITNADNPDGKIYTKTVYVGSDPFIPEFTVTSTENDNGTFTVNFNNLTTDPEISDQYGKWTLIWNFGGDEGTPDPVETFDISEDISHTYENSGTYTATLTVQYTTYWPLGTKTSQTFSHTFNLNSKPAVEYCTPVDDPQYEEIESFTINGSVYSDADNNVEAGTIINYEDPIILNADSENTYEIVAKYSDDNLYAENYHIWIDLNGDGKFDNESSNELVVNDLDHTTGYYGNGFVSGTFTIDKEDIKTSNAQMRVFQVYSGRTTTPIEAFDTCVNYTDFSTKGEIEDYVVELVK